MNSTDDLAETSASPALSRRVAKPSAVGRNPQLWLTSLVSDLTLRLCILFVLAMIFMPADGLGVDTCMSQLVTKAPCPGCGMTRCGANLVQGNFTRAVQYHPFGSVVIPIIVLLALVGVLPRRWREAFRRRMLASEPRLRPLWWFAFGSFLVFGVLRWAGVEFGLLAFPATWP